MKTQPKLLRVLTPPYVPLNHLLLGVGSNGPSSVVSKALSLHLSQTAPTSTLPQDDASDDHAAHTPTPAVTPGAGAAAAAGGETKLLTVHPCAPLVAYLLLPSGDKNAAIVVQHSKTRKVVWSSTLGELAAQLGDDASALSNAAASRQHKAIKELGRVQRLDFFDASTLYWSGYFDSRADNNGSKSRSSASANSNANRWSHLFIQFSNRIVIVNLRQGTRSICTAGTVSSSSPYRSIIANITQETVKGIISSNAVPIAPHLILIATTDGLLKVYDWQRKTIVHTAKSLLGKSSDWIVHICGSANPYPNWKQSDVTNAKVDPKATTKKRIIVLTKKGSAYVIEMVLCPASLAPTSKRSEAPLYVQDILPPIARLEGGTVPTSMSKADDEHHSMEHILASYDAFRDLFMWCLPSKFKAKLFVWDLAKMPRPDSKQRKKSEPVRPDPTLTMQLPFETSHTFVPGWLHESVPLDSMVCIVVTKEGYFQILVAPLYNSGSSVKNPFAAIPVQSVQLGDVLQRDLDLNESPSIRVQNINITPLHDSSLLYVGCNNAGTLVIRMRTTDLVPLPGSRHAHLSASLGSLGKSVFTITHSEIVYGSLQERHIDTSKSSTQQLSVSPIGDMESRSTVTVYKSPPPLHLPPDVHKRPVRMPPCFLPSPSRTYLCCFWRNALRYEILHVPTMLQRVSSRSDSGKPPVVASGNGVASFAWIGDDRDVFALLYNPEQDLALKVGIDLSAPNLASAASKVTDLSKLTELSKLKEIAKLNTYTSTAKTFVGTANKLKSLEGLRDIANSAQKSVKGVTKVGVGTVKLTSKVAVGTTKVAVGGARVAVGRTTKVVGGAAKVSKVAIGGAAKVATFGLLHKRKTQKSQAAQSSLAQSETQDEDDAKIATVAPSVPDTSTDSIDNSSVLASEQVERKHPWVELRSLESDSKDSLGNGATISNLGELTLRSGNRNPPTVLFGGPILCVGSKIDDHDEGLAYFYTQKKGENDSSASSYISSGPAFPCPDIVSWDDEGQLCAVVFQSRVAIYLSDEPDFVLLGSVQLGSQAEPDIQITSVKFVHGVLYCTTRTSVHCVFLGSLEGGICHLDTFALSSVTAATIPNKSLVSDYASLTPPTLPMPLNYPVVLGYQSGSLILSTVAGLQAIPLSHPLLRIGSLIGAGQIPRAEKWLDAVPNCDHESLANFLDRRGVPEMAFLLLGLSLETTVDLCLRYGFTDRLEEVVNLYGLKGLRAIDMGRGVSANIFGPDEHGASVVVCVSAYLLSQGKVELVRRLASECLTLGEDGKRDAFLLANLLLSVSGSDSKRVIERAIEDANLDDWAVGSFVRDHVLITHGR